MLGWHFGLIEPVGNPRREFRNCLRLNYGHPWTADFDRAMAQLARIVSEQAGRGASDP
jgi:DNA-binding transcriptional MocR family regulator